MDGLFPAKYRYISLDIETSGFDPETEEVLEVGFCVFDVSSSGCEIVSEWTRVFKPSKPVSSKILSLTGISQAELDAAAPFEESKAELQELLGTAGIVGHNISFDIRFLQKNGITFGGEAIDTLELVQFVLPTHHSYNLENLAHYLQIPHADAHRALPDARAAVVLLDRLLVRYAGYPAELKAEAEMLLKGSGLPWELLLGVVSAPLSPLDPKPKAQKYSPLGELPEQAFIVAPVSVDVTERFVGALQAGDGKYHVSVASSDEALDLWRRGFGTGYFSSEHLLDEEKLKVFLKKVQKTREETIFLLKVLVWKHTNWQSSCLLDLNTSFAGGQFRAAVSGPKEVKKPTSTVIVSDHASTIELCRGSRKSTRVLAIMGLQSFEQAVSTGLSSKVSWGYVSYILKNFYNPETGTGDELQKETVLSMLAATDLFFGLVSGMLGNDQEPGFSYVTLTESVILSGPYQKIAGAARNFAEKLALASKTLGAAELSEAAENLENFFGVEKPGTVRWIELSEGRCSLVLSPVGIGDQVEGLTARFGGSWFVDTVSDQTVLRYFKTRFGALKTPTVVWNWELSTEPTLFSESAAPKVAKEIKELEFDAKALEALVEGLPLPAAVLLPGQLQVKELHDLSYEKLQERAFLLVQSTGGSVSRLVRNFSIHDNSLLIASGRGMLKYLDAGAKPVRAAAARSLVIAGIPFDQFTHPLQQAINAQFTNAFEEVSLPKAVHSLHRLISFFAGPKLERVVLWDAKLKKPYARVLKDYFGSAL